MRKLSTLSLTLLLSGVLILSACSPAAVEQTTASDVQVVEPSGSDVEAGIVEEPAQDVVQTVESLPVESAVDVESLLAEKLTGSPHTMEFILSQEKTQEEWETTIDRMIGHGLKINEEEKALIIEWLVNR